MIFTINKRRSPQRLRAFSILTTGILFAAATSPTAHARVQSPPPSADANADADDTVMVPVFVEVDAASLVQSEQPAEIAKADAQALRTRIPELLEQRGVELARESGPETGHLRVSVGWKYYKESIYQVQVVYTGPDGAEHTSDWTLEGIDSGDVLDEFDARLDQYEAWFSAQRHSRQPTSQTPPEKPTKPTRAWLAVGISGAALAGVGAALAVTGAVISPDKRLDSAASSDMSLGQSGTEDNGTRRALVYSGAALAGVGVALAAVGFSLHFSKKNRDKRAQRASLAPMLGQGVAGLSATGRF